MKVIIRIGHREYLLPTDRGLATLTTLLGKAREVRRDHSHPCYGKDRYIELQPEDEERDLDLTATLISDRVKIRTYQPEPPLALPEHGTRDLLGLPERGSRDLLGLPEHGSRES